VRFYFSIGFQPSLVVLSAEPAITFSGNTGFFMIKPSELEYTFFRSSGPGGQKKNTTDSAVRLRHLPTGIVVTATESRSQHKNKELALKALERRIAARRHKPKKRRPTRPTKAARKRRIDEKKQQSRKKDLRKTPKRQDW
jgi:protein subunit release factor B